MSTSMLPTKRVAYGDATISAVRQGNRIYATHEGKTVFDRQFGTVAMAKNHFGQMTSVEPPRRQSQQETVFDGMSAAFG